MHRISQDEKNPVSPVHPVRNLRILRVSVVSILPREQIEKIFAAKAGLS